MSGNGKALPKTADIVILGAGVMGASIAFQLAQRGAGKILVLDKEFAGSGGSGRSSALVRMHYSFPPEVQLALVSLDIFRRWTEIVGERGDFRKTGFVRLVHPTEMELLRKNVDMQRALGANVQLIDRKELRELEPEWDVSEVVQAAYEPDSGYGDGSNVATDFLAAARAKGVAYAPRARATRFIVEGGKVRGVRTEHGEVSAPVVVAATGPWSKPLFAGVGFEPPIETEYHEVAILSNAPEMRGGGCACIDSVSATYFRPYASDKFLVGDFYGKRGADPDQFPQRPEESSLAELIARAVRRLPRLQNAGIMRGVTGVYDMTPDCRPLLGEVPGVAGLHLCAGFSGMGFKISPAIGVVMSELLTEGRAKTVDIEAFRPGRFAEGKPIRAEFEYVDD